MFVCPPEIFIFKDSLAALPRSPPTHLANSGETGCELWYLGESWGYNCDLGTPSHYLSPKRDLLLVGAASGRGMHLSNRVRRVKTRGLLGEARLWRMNVRPHKDTTRKCCTGGSTKKCGFVKEWNH